MKLNVTLKSLGKRKNYLTNKEFEIKGNPSTLRELLTEFVAVEVERFNSISPGERIVGFLTDKKVLDLAENGKIGFSTVYDERKANCQQAVESCIQSFVDGLFKVFLTDKEIMELDVPLSLRNGDQLTFIRLTMLAGRMW